MTLDSKTRHGPGELADSVGTAARATLGMIRRMAIKVTSKALWQVIGHRMLDGSRETRDAEVFYGIGVWARPKSSDKAEALVFFQGGGAGSPLIVSTRNEDARRAVEAAIGSLKEGEAVLYGSSGLGFVHVRDNQTVEVRKSGGSAVALATKADLQTLKDAISNAAIVANDGGASLKSTILAALAAWPVGTSVLKGQ